MEADPNKSTNFYETQNAFIQNENMHLANFCYNLCGMFLGAAAVMASDENSESESSSEDEDEEIERCHVCNADFSCKKGLNQHIGKVHSQSNKTILCTKCGKSFKNANALKSHIKQVHDKTTRVPCKKCGKLIYNKYMMKAHMAREHPAQTNIS